MITGFNTTVSNNNKQNFCAIIPKHYEDAQKAVQNKLNYGSPVETIQDLYGLRKISKTDANDTLDAIKNIYPDKFKSLVDDAKEWIETFK